ncbi:17934_t:CDS:2, partial [Funneliformis geosporum]
VKYDDPLTATEIYEERYVRSLPNEGDIYVGSPWETGKTYILEHLTISDDVNLLVLSTRHSYSNAVTTRLNLKSYCDIDGNINLSDHKRVVCQIESLHRITNNLSIIAQAQSHLAGQSIEKLYKLIQDARHIIVMDNDLTDLNEGKTFRLAPNKETDVQGIVRALKTGFPELRIKEYHGKSDPEEKAHNFSNVEESWKDLDLIAYTSTLKIGVSCTNPKFERAF